MYLFTDGAAIFNGYKPWTMKYLSTKYNLSLKSAGSYAYCIYNDQQKLLHSFNSPVIYTNPTNNRMELISLISGLDYIQKLNTTEEINVVTDSMYVINSWNYVLKTTLVLDFNFVGTKPNLDILNLLHKYIKLPVNFQKVKAHTENLDFFSQGNKKVDHLAELNLKTEPGYEYSNYFNRI